MKVLYAKTINDMDKKQIEKGILSIELMEDAAKEFVKTLCSKKVFKSVLIACGKGNNGGDGFAIGRLLIDKGYDVKFIYFDDDMKVDCRTNYDLISNINKIKVESLNDISGIDFNTYDIIIDCIFGTGFRGEIEGIIGETIENINSSSALIVSCDIPSGVSGNDNQISKISVKADMTITFTYPKTGIGLYPGRAYAGDIIVIDIGIEKKIKDLFDDNIYFLDDNKIKNLMPERKEDSHKGDFGRVGFLAGGPGMIGASLLCSKTALIAGCGLSYLYLPSSIAKINQTNEKEVIIREYKDVKAIINLVFLDKLIESYKDLDVLSIGPGLKNAKNTDYMVMESICYFDKYKIIDAQGINILSRYINDLKIIGKNTVLTPHMMEFSRLTGIDIEIIKKDKIKYLKDFCIKYNTNVVLKDANSMICSYDGNVYISQKGNSGMATAGSGDVLTGLIAGFLSQGIDPFNASLCGVYLHGLSGDIAKSKKTDYSLVATDIMENIPFAIKEILNGGNHGQKES